MQAIPALFATLGGGAAAGAAGAAATATTLSTISTGLQVIGTVAGIASATSQASYQAKVAENNAIIAQRNAEQAVLDSQREAKDRGILAAAEMGQLLAQQSAGGLSLGSGSYSLARKSQAELAARDTSYIAEEGQRSADAYLQQEADFRNEASQAKSAKKFAVFEGALNIGSSLVSGATKINKIKAGKYA